MRRWAIPKRLCSLGEDDCGVARALPVKSAAFVSQEARKELFFNLKLLEHSFLRRTIGNVD